MSTYSKLFICAEHFFASFLFGTRKFQSMYLSIQWNPLLFQRNFSKLHLLANSGCMCLFFINCLAAIGTRGYPLEGPSKESVAFISKEGNYSADFWFSSIAECTFFWSPFRLHLVQTNSAVILMLSTYSVLAKTLSESNYASYPDCALFNRVWDCAHVIWCLYV